ncbi:hypothetical protein CsSME_00001703 [Camellia sinensis var. sinensis]
MDTARRQTLRMEDGTFCSDPVAIQQAFLNHLKTFNSSNGSGPELLDSPFVAQEVKEAVFFMEGLKAPSPNGEGSMESWKKLWMLNLPPKWASKAAATWVALDSKGNQLVWQKVSFVFSITLVVDARACFEVLKWCVKTCDNPIPYSKIKS